MIDQLPQNPFFLPLRTNLCTAIIMNQNTLDSEQWKKDEFLNKLLKIISPDTIPVMVNSYVPDDKILFYEPSKELSKIIREYNDKAAPSLARKEKSQGEP